MMVALACCCALLCTSLSPLSLSPLFCASTTVASSVPPTSAALPIATKISGALKICLREELPQLWEQFKHLCRKDTKGSPWKKGDAIGIDELLFHAHEVGDLENREVVNEEWAQELISEVMHVTYDRDVYWFPKPGKVPMKKKTSKRRKKYYADKEAKKRADDQKKADGLIDDAKDAAKEAVGELADAAKDTVSDAVKDAAKDAAYGAAAHVWDSLDTGIDVRSKV